MLNPFLGYLVLSLVAGVVLFTFMLAEGRGRVADTREALLLLLVPAIGWGWWAHGHARRQGIPDLPPRKAFVFGRMGWLHLVVAVIGYLMLITLVSYYSGKAMMDMDPAPSMTNATGAIIQAGLEGVGNLFIGMGAIIAAFVGLIYLLMIVLVMSGIPWLIAHMIRSDFNRERLRRLENDVRKRG